MAAKKKTQSKPTQTPTTTFGSKTRFVLGLAPELSAKQVVEEAKRNGIAIAEAHVHNIRSLAKSKATKSSVHGRHLPQARRAATAGAATARYANHEALLLEASMHVGLAKASDLLDRVREHVRGGF